ncbi:MAG: hypothetical protein ACK5RL_08835 [Acidimicrobiales bacterium]
MVATIRDAAGQPISLATLLSSAQQLPVDVEHVLQDRLAELDGPTVAAFREFAKYDELPIPAFAALLGDEPGALRRLGVPCYSTRRGWVALPPLVRELVSDDSPADPRFARLVSPILVAKSGILDAAKALVIANAAEEAASIVSSAPPSKLDEVPPPELIGLIEVLQRHVPDRADLLLRKARGHRALAQLGEERACVGTAIELALDHGDDRVALEAQVEQVYLDIGADESEATVRLLEQLRARTSADHVDPVVRTRLREIEAMRLAKLDPLESHRSVEMFRQVASEWEHLGERSRAASTLRVMAAGPLNSLGAYARAVNSLERALALVPDMPFSLALTYELLARFKALLGDAEGFKITDQKATGLADAMGIAWLTGYVMWGKMLAEVMHDDLENAKRYHLWAVSSLGQLLSHETGATFHAESAVTFAVLGDGTAATSSLLSARTASQAPNLDIRIAEAVCEARFGDPAEAARRLQELNDGGVPLERLWRIEIEKVVLARRDPGPTERDRQAERRCLELATEQGAIEMAQLLLARSVGRATTPRSERVTITLLGRFAVAVADEEVEVPAGQLPTLLKLIALEPTGVRVEVVVDTLWPDASEALGRRRLKNIVRRTRSILGDEAVIRSDDRLRLGEAVHSDISVFLQAVGRSTGLAADDDETAVSAAMQTLHLYTGDLLPDDLYADWTVPYRASLRAHALATFEYVLNRVDEVYVPAVWLLRTADRLAIESERAYVRIARRASDQSSEETARVALVKAQMLAEDMGVPLTGVDGMEGLLPA